MWFTGFAHLPSLQNRLQRLCQMHKNFYPIVFIDIFIILQSEKRQYHKRQRARAARVFRLYRQGDSPR